ncbi:MAG: DMT family transporter [Burkholderiales bacterium]
MTRSAAVGLMLLAPLLWSSAGVVTRHIERAEPFEQVFWRSLFAFAFVALSISILNRTSPVKMLRAAGLPGLFSGVMWAIMFTAFVIALSLTSTANTLVTMSISPLLTVLFARIALSDPLPLRTWVAAGAAAIGIVWMFGGSLEDAGHVAGMLVAFLVPVAAALNVVVLRASAAKVDLIPAVMLGGALSCLIALPLALPLSASPRDLFLLGLLGVFQLGLPCMLLVIASRALLAPELALLGLLEVVLGPLWAWLGAGEVPAGSTLIGGAMVLAALAGNELAAFRRIIQAKLSVTRISG